MSFHDLNSVWHEEKLVFYDVFRGLSGKVYALAPLLYTKWVDAGPGQAHPSFDLDNPPLPMVSRPDMNGVLSQVFIDQINPHVFYGGTLVYPSVYNFHWHAILFEFDITAPEQTEIVLYFSINGRQSRVALVLPEPPAERYKYTNATMFRNDNEIIEEWLDHCFGVGFDQMFLYDNWSIEPIPEHPNVTVIPFPFPYYYTYPSNWNTNGLYNIDGQGLGSQIPHQMHALYKYGSMVDWMGFFDTDEYPNLLRHDTIGDFLSQDGGRAAVSLPSAFFGGEKAFEDEDSIRVKFQWRERPTDQNGFCYGRKKMLVNVKNILPGEHVGIHDFVGRDPYKNMERGEFATDVRRQASFEEARFNHYAQVSMRRRDSQLGGWWVEERDETILRFL